MKEELVKLLLKCGIAVQIIPEGQEKQFMEFVRQQTGEKHFQRKADAVAPFYSNAEKAVKDIRQDKAAPAQWLAMLTNKGGIKAGEDKWLGLSQWLKESTDKTLTKSQVLDYVNSHRINLQEQVFLDFSHFSIPKELQDEMDGYVRQFQDEFGLGDDSVYDRAYKEMWLQHGADFRRAFNHWDGYLEIRDEEEAARFLGVGVIDDTRLDNTTVELTDKKEIALYVPDVDPFEKDDTIHFGGVGDGTCIAWIRFGETRKTITYEQDEWEEMQRQLPMADQWTATDYDSNYIPQLWYPPVKNDRYPDAHISFTNNQYRIWGVKGMLCNTHPTLDDAVRYYNRYMFPKQKTQRILVVDEIQSNRHQEANRKQGAEKKGYATPGVRTGYDKVIVERMKCSDAYYNCIRDIKMAKGVELGVADETMVQWRSEYPRLGALWQKYLDSDRAFLQYYEDHKEDLKSIEEQRKVPAAPFEKNWHELCLRRMIRYAAENGFDTLAWTTGVQQADRYDLGDHLDKVVVEPCRAEQSTDGVDRYDLHFYTRYNATIDLSVNKEGVILGGQYEKHNFTGTGLSKLVGHDFADKILQTDMDENSVEYEVKGHVGGQKVKTFYDELLPNVMNRYARQWGGQVKDMTVIDDQYIMHAINITPEMKSSVMQGQPMFMRDKQGELYGMTIDDRIYVTQKGFNAETLMHEYTHLWAMAMMNGNPEGWQSVKDLLKDTALWDEVRQDPLYAGIRDNEDYVASEALARISGKANAHKIEDMARKTEERNKAAGRNTTGQSVVRSLRSALGKFWSWVGTHMFDIKEFSVIGEVTDRVLHDLLKGTRLETGKVIARPQTVSNPRITDVTVYEGKLGVPHIRCKVDGVQQMGRPMTRGDFEQWAVSREADNLADKYFKQELDNTQNNVKNRKR